MARTRFSNWLMGLRLKNKLSQSDISKALRLKSGQYISNLERGKCGITPKAYGLMMRKLDMAGLLFKEETKEEKKALFMQGLKSILEDDADQSIKIFKCRIK